MRARNAVDALYIALLLREIEGRIVGRRIERIESAWNDAIAIAVEGALERLVFDAGAIAPRVGWERVRSGARAEEIEASRVVGAARGRLLGQAIERIAQPDGDRWVHLHVEGGWRLAWENLGRRANLLLVEGETIVACLRSYAPGAPGVKRPLVAGGAYPPPPAREHAPRHPRLEGLLGAGERDIGASADTVRAPCVVTIPGAEPVLADIAPGEERVVSARHPDAHVQTFTSYAEAAAAWGAVMMERAARAAVVAALRTHWRGSERAAARALAAVERDLEWARRGPEMRRFGEALVASFHLVSRGAAEARVPDPRDPATILSVPLDPTKSPQENASRYFKDAKRGERGVPLLVARREKLAAEHARAAAQRARWADADALEIPLGDLVQAADAARLDVRQLARVLDRGPHPKGTRPQGSPVAPAHGGSGDERRGAPDRGSWDRARGVTAEGFHRRKPRDPYFGARLYRYEVTGGFTVLVGRSNADNDLLTHKVARPWDLWFHSGQTSGSHVILVKGNAKAAPPKEALLEAAGLAAYHSKARKGGLVPVIYTEKRHVRKPRGSPAGLAACAREKTLFVRPDALEAKRVASRDAD